MRVLVTGSEGYIGAVLRESFVARGHDLIGLDTGYFSDCDFHCAPIDIPVLQRDLRQVEPEDFHGVDAVVHLAALSNDPLGALDSDLTDAINTQGSIRCAEMAKEAGVERFLFSSSCSMYGAGSSQGLTEESGFHPQTAYAQSKVDVEATLQELADDSFSPTYFRNATAYGLSPRLRFDLVVNNLSGWAFTTGQIRMLSDGSPWRPLVHIRDIAKAFLCALDAPRESIHNQSFNVGSNDTNYQIRTIAEMVGEVFTGCETTFGNSDGDSRTYNVNFDKIHRDLPGFDGIDWPLNRAIRELKAAFEAMALRDDQFESRLYTRLKQINHLRKSGQIDDRLFWAEAHHAHSE
jgi:nucleoside-diphosphate-sugar epimerase